MHQKAGRMLRVLIVTDVRVVQESMRCLLDRRGEVEVLAAIDVSQASEHSERLQPDVILFDVARQDSIELLQALVAAAPASKVVAFGVKETNENILALAAAGTAGYVCNNAECSDVVKVLVQVMSDELTCSARAAASLYRRVAALSKTSPSNAGNGPVAVDNGSAQVVPLSRRELQIAHLIERGLTNKEIGREQGIEAATVKNHVHNMCEKLNVHRRGEVAARLRMSRVPAGNAKLRAPELNPALEAR
jgi:DNA-binding NarL/FixJ family response regulator